MAGKKAKPRKTVKKIDYGNLNACDVLCPICRTILIEPVTLSCNHAFCKLCFQGTMENANLVCPLCRVRVGSWFRKAKKEGKLVDERLWEAIQAQYPAELQNRYQGIDNVMETDKPIIIVANPGEIRKEYEQQRQKEVEEQNKIREAEEKASAPLIKRLREEEEHKKKLEEEKLRLDATLARKLAEDLVKPTTSKILPKKPTDNRKDGKKYGPMDKFIKTEETKLNRRALNENEEHKKHYRGARRISITPNPASNFATKEYTCHVLNAESRSKEPVNSFSIFNKPSHTKPSYASEIPTVEKKIRHARKIEELRKNICKSGYNSSESGSDDTIAQECKFYFKPIDTQRRHHLPGTIPQKVPSVKGREAQNVHIVPPTGKILNLQLGTVLSAFARFSMVLHQKPQPSSLPVHKVIQDHKSDAVVGSSNKLKRKLLDEDTPVRRKGRRQIYTKKNVQYIDCSTTISSPFYGFDNEPSRSVNRSPFYGFNTLEIKESNQEKDTMKGVYVEQEQTVVDNKSLVNTEEFYRTMKTYSRHQTRQFKHSSKAEPMEERLKLHISRTPKNGINMSEAIRNKLAELRSSLEGPSDLTIKDYQSKTNIDINRNIPKETPQASISGLGDGDLVGWNLNCSDTKMTLKTRATLKNTRTSEDEPAINISRKQNDYVSNGNDNKIEDLDILLNSARNDSGVHMENDLKTTFDMVDSGHNDSPKATSTRKVRSRRPVDTGSIVALAGSELVDAVEKDASIPTFNSFDGTPSSTISSPISADLNGSWRTRKRNGSPKKARKDIKSQTIEADSLVADRTSPVIGKTPAATDLHTTPKSTRLNDASHSVHKTFPTRTRKDTNSKITDTFSKIKSSPTKSKNTIRTLKLSPAKTKLNNNTDALVIDQRQMQEQFDFEMAKKLQAEFDSIQTPSRTRRGTKRQITLDEMLSI